MMNRKLFVFFHNEKIGELIQDSSAQLSFSYDEIYLNKDSAQAISLSLPLEKKVFSDNECRAYFSGLLPEDTVRVNLAKYLQISEKNDFSFLEILGGDCAGAVALYQDEKPELKQLKPQKLSKAKLKKVFSMLNTSPLLTGEAIRLSLAGAQNKLALLKKGEDWYLPGTNEISTHIIKPNIESFEDSVFNEYFCLQLAQKLGISVVESSIFSLDNEPYLVLKRYDREQQRSTVTRMHQEDFCQILAIAPEMKYQSEGGINIEQCFKLVEEYSSKASIDKINLLNLMIFNLLIGNHDAHAKNFSILYSGNQQKISLAPFYDLLSTAIYPSLSSKMAMKFGDNYKFEKLNQYDLKKFIESTNMSKSFVLEKFSKMLNRILDEAEALANQLQESYSSSVYKKIIKVIKSNVNKLDKLTQNLS